jgi:hypothetical protein
MRGSPFALVAASPGGSREGRGGGGEKIGHGKEPSVNDEEHEHPKGALTLMLIYLFILALLWTNAYLRLWG